MSLVGSKVRIISDNENYAPYLGLDLIIDSAINSEEETGAYDSCMDGMYLCDLSFLDGSEFPFSLYEYEFERF